MLLAAGDKLGPYEILAPLGVGGMGEVYRARDTKLEREVAIKVLPAAVAQDPERLARFEREAKVLASLNHPNIAQIYGIEESNSDRALVMELVPGETLRTPLPQAEALRIAVQIAEALEAAHDKGIIHRDLKPANIMITPQGVAKVLDFGLAAVPQRTTDSNVTNSPTLTMQATQAGMIMGTAGYMSPEQASGQAVDKRADIWSFGVVLWEMLCGQRMFTGSTVAHILADVLRAPIDLEKLPKETPRAVRELLKRCLDRDVKTRLRDIGEVRVAILNLGKELDADVGDGRGPGSPPHLHWVVASMLAVALAVSLWAPWRAEKVVDRPLVRLDVDLGADVSLPDPTTGGSSVAISPDGTRLAYLSGTPTKLFTRRLDQPKAIEIPETHAEFFFSPDGQWLGFFKSGKLNKISVEGGPVVPLADLVNFSGGSWGEEGSILVTEATEKGLMRISATGSPAELVAGLGNGEVVFSLPQILPGGKAVLFNALTAMDWEKSSIEVLTLADRHRKVLVRGGVSPRYLPTSIGIGHLIYVSKANLFAIPFDLAKLETYGTAVPVLSDVAYHPRVGTGQFDFSPAPSGHGTLVYRRASGSAAPQLMTLQWAYPNSRPTGKREPLGAQPAAYRAPSLSPDGKRIALHINREEKGADIWVYDPQREALTRLTFGGEPKVNPIWSPDGQYVIFESPYKGIFQIRADGAGQPQVLTESHARQVPQSLTPVGKRLAYTEIDGGNYQIWTVPLEDQGGRLKAGKPEQFLKSTFNDLFPAFSPDGRWLAYQSNESGKNEVYVRAFPQPASGQGGKWQVSNSGGGFPRWSRNGHELLYEHGDQILAASYTVKGDAFVAEKPRVWLDKLLDKLGTTGWDLAPDGKRVLVLAKVESEEKPKQEHEIVMLLNFFDYLRQRVPLGK